ILFYKMSNKSKGANMERELVSMFSQNGWRALRCAGSGVNDDSPCDIIAGKSGIGGYAIEAKSSRGDYIYIKKPQIDDFLVFTTMIGLKPAIAVRFTHEGWLFLTPDFLQDSGKNWVISRENAKLHGKRFSQFFA